jgi:hypothetical protein
VVDGILTDFSDSFVLPFYEFCFFNVKNLSSYVVFLALKMKLPSRSQKRAQWWGSGMHDCDDQKI